MQLWQEWWVWMAAGLVLAILEVMVSGYVLLGFAAGAVLTSLLVWIGLLGATLPPLLLVWAVSSLAAWAVLRQLFGLPRDGVRIVKHDINEN